MKVFFMLALLLFSAGSYAQPAISFVPVINGLSSPMQFVHPGDGTNRIFIVGKGGEILVFDRGYAFLDTFINIRNISDAGEGGLLSMAFHPSYATNGFFYVYYTSVGGDLEISRYRVSVNANQADTLSGVIVKTIPHPVNTNHNGGELHFGSDGYLYLSTGDGGGGGDQPNNAQTTSILLGKILRFAVNTSLTPPYYTIPPDNPFGNEVYCYGLRNPFRWSFDRETNDIWIGDVGQDSWEEFNFRPAAQVRGTNFGWRCFEGDAIYNQSVGCAGPATNYNFPVYAYATPTPSGAVTGGMVYRGNTCIELRGWYVGTDFYTGKLYRTKYDPGTQTTTTTIQTPLSPITYITDFGETEDGELFITSMSTGVYRIATSGAKGYTFTGNGNWNDAANWRNETIPPADLPAGSEILIEPAGNGEAVLNIPQTILSGAKIYVRPGKKFKVNGNLVIQ